MKPPTYAKQLQVAYIQNIRKYKSCPAAFAMIALTYRCQCKCVHCGVASYKQARKNELRYGEVIRLIDEFKRMKVVWIHFFGGEPLIVPQLADYIKYAKHNGLKTRLDTNGLLLDEGMARRLKGAGIDLICVSIDSPLPASHDKLRGIDGIFNKAMAGIRYCKQYGIECQILTYATKENLKNSELTKMIELAMDLNVTLGIASPKLVGRWLDRKELALSEEEIILLRSLLKANKVYWENDVIDSKEIPFFCSAMNRCLFYISAYGEIQPCCYLPVSFGNIDLFT